MWSVWQIVRRMKTKILGVKGWMWILESWKNQNQSWKSPRKLLNQTGIISEIIYTLLLSIKAVVFIPSQGCLETPLQKVKVMMKDVSIILTALAIKRKDTAVITTIMATKEKVPQGWILTQVLVKKYLKTVNLLPENSYFKFCHRKLFCIFFMYMVGCKVKIKELPGCSIDVVRMLERAFDIFQMLVFFSAKVHSKELLK